MITLAAHCTRQRGATLMEMMVTVAVSVVLLSIATPSLMQNMIRQELRVIRDELAVAMHLAEIESARRGLPVILARRTGCGIALSDAKDWSCGYRMFADANNNDEQEKT